MISWVNMCERCVCKYSVDKFNPDKMKEYKISENVGRIEIDSSHHPYRVPVPDRIDLREYGRYRLEDKHPNGISEYGNKIKDDGPGMSGLDRILLAIIHTPQTILTIVLPVGTRICLPLHDDRTVWAGFCTEPTSDTVVIGEHHLSHEKSTDQQISRQE